MRLQTSPFLSRLFVTVRVGNYQIYIGQGFLNLITIFYSYLGERLYILLTTGFLFENMRLESMLFFLYQVRRSAYY